MNRADIIRMAREAGLNCPVNFEANSSYAQKIERFAALVAAAEREAEKQEPVAYRFKERPDDLRSAWRYVSKKQHVPHGWPYQSLSITGETK